MHIQTLHVACIGVPIPCMHAARLIIRCIHACWLDSTRVHHSVWWRGIAGKCRESAGLQHDNGANRRCAHDHVTAVCQCCTEAIPSGHIMFTMPLVTVVATSVWFLLLSVWVARAEYSSPLWWSSAESGGLYALPGTSALLVGGKY